MLQTSIYLIMTKVPIRKLEIHIGIFISPSLSCWQQFAVTAATQPNTTNYIIKYKNVAKVTKRTLKF
jgi:hypothetical protein